MAIPSKQKASYAQLKRSLQDLLIPVLYSFYMCNHTKNLEHSWLKNYIILNNINNLLNISTIFLRTKPSKKYKYESLVKYKL